MRSGGRAETGNPNASAGPTWDRRDSNPPECATDKLRELPARNPLKRFATRQITFEVVVCLVIFCVVPRDLCFQTASAFLVLFPCLPSPYSWPPFLYEMTAAPFAGDRAHRSVVGFAFFLRIDFFLPYHDGHCEEPSLLITEPDQTGHRPHCPTDRGPAGPTFGCSC